MFKEEKQAVSGDKKPVAPRAPARTQVSNQSSSIILEKKGGSSRHSANGAQTWKWGRFGILCTVIPTYHKTSRIGSGRQYGLFVLVRNKKTEWIGLAKGIISHQWTCGRKRLNVGHCEFVMSFRALPIGNRTRTSCCGLPAPRHSSERSVALLITKSQFPALIDVCAHWSMGEKVHC